MSLSDDTTTDNGNSSNNNNSDRASSTSTSFSTASSSTSSSSSSSSTLLAGTALLPLPTCRRFSCRARGMPLDHNIKTAYLIIPENVQHGDELRCSYRACKEQGVKFCYCAYCRSPVAKRNFRIRHHHAQDHKALEQQKRSQTTKEVQFVSEIPLQVKQHQGGKTHTRPAEVSSSEAPASSSSSSCGGLNPTLSKPQGGGSSHSAASVPRSFNSTGPIASHFQSLSAAAGQQQFQIGAGNQPQQQQQQMPDLATVLLTQLLSTTMNPSGVAGGIPNLSSLAGLPLPNLNEAMLALASPAPSSNLMQNDGDDTSSDSSQSDEHGLKTIAAAAALGPVNYDDNDDDDIVMGNTLEFKMKIPCPARGMPSGHHRLEAAHFVIPRDAEHGDDLICSFPACQDAGVKFCFCLYCQIPVSKRNFRRLHHHRDQVAGKKLTLEDNHTKRSPTSFSSNNGGTLVCQEIKSPPKQQGKKYKYDERKPNSSNTSIAGMKRKREEIKEVNRVSAGSSADDMVNAEGSSSSSTTEKDNSTNEGEDSSDSDNMRGGEGTLGPEREMIWLELLGARPEDTAGKAMVDWLEKVVSVSEPSQEN